MPPKLHGFGDFNQHEGKSHETQVAQVVWATLGMVVELKCLLLCSCFTEERHVKVILLLHSKSWPDNPQKTEAPS